MNLLPFHDMHAQDETAVKQVVTQFIASTDQQDATALATTLHDKAMQYVLFGSSVLTFNKEEYLTQVKDKKVGGKPRTIEWHESLFSGDALVTVKLKATSAVLVFNYQITLMKSGEAWVINAITTHVERV